MDHVYQLELACADAWPALVDVPLGRWRLRAADGFTGRANSALTVGDPGRPMVDALAEVRTFADGHGIPAKAHVVHGSRHEPALVAAGWVVDARHAGGAEAAVMVGSVAGLSGAVPDRVGVSVVPPDGWWSLAVGSAAPSVAQRRVLCGADLVGFGVARSSDGLVTGVVRGAVVGDLLHVSRLAVSPAFRRLGVATGLLAALARWGLGHGAVRCVLQVATHNAAAIELYGRRGCRPHHRYRYWVPAG